VILLDLMMPRMDGWNFRHEQVKDDERPGKAFDPNDDSEAHPQLFFTSRFDESGAWKGSRASEALIRRRGGDPSAGEGSSRGDQ
jgi:CheY-like chemotaxis protein